VLRHVPLGQKIVLLHFASSVSSSNILKCDDLLNRKSCKVPKTGLICAVVRQMRFLVLRKNKSQRENSCSQPPSSRINVVCTNDRFIINPTKKCQKGKIGINFVLPLCLGNTARHLRQLLHPSVEEFNYTRQDRVKRVSS
jgi:hypothetical protein